MPNRFSRLRKIPLAAACALTGFALVPAGILVGAAQFSEASGNKETLSLASFVVILAFSALAFNWCRVPEAFAPGAALQQVYRAGVQLFLSSLQALLSAFFAWIQTASQTTAPWAGGACFSLHLLFLALALGFFLAAMFRILLAILKSPAGG